MFVLEALLLTFLTTPVVVVLYPPKYRKRAVIAGSECNNIIDHEDTPKDAIGQYRLISRLTVILDKLEHLPSIISMIQLFRPFVLDLSQQEPPNSVHSSPNLEGGAFPPSLTASPSTIQALRLIELSEYTIANMNTSIAGTLIHTDPLLNLFKTFCDMSNIPVSPSLSVVSFDEFATIVTDHARETLSHMVVVPWLPFHDPTTHNSDYPHTSGDHRAPDAQRDDMRSTKPIDMLSNSGIVTESSPGPHSQFVRGIFTQSSVNVALFMSLDRGHSESGDYSHQHVVFPFFGGADDRLALMMVVGMCGNSETTAKVIRVARHTGSATEECVPEFSHTPVNDGQGRTIITDVQHNGHTNRVGHG